MSWEEIVRTMRDRLPSYVAYTVVDVIFSRDGEKRFIILKSTHTGYFTFVFEVLKALDEDEIMYFAYRDVPAYWEVCDDGFYRVFADMDILVKELKSTPQWKTWFV